jgi:hypothetical protein
LLLDAQFFLGELEIDIDDPLLTSDGASKATLSPVEFTE